MSLFVQIVLVLLSHVSRILLATIWLFATLLFSICYVLIVLVRLGQGALTQASKHPSVAILLPFLSL